MKTLLGLLLFIPAGALRFIIFAVGTVLILFPPLMHCKWKAWRLLYGASDDLRIQFLTAGADPSWWEYYVEMAWRNPTNGLKYWWIQPIPEVKPNPDFIVRTEFEKSAHRWMQHGIYWEYWYMRRIDWHVPKWVPKFGGKHYIVFEFRIGWKFVDGNEEFFPTFQLGPRSS